MELTQLVEHLEAVLGRFGVRVRHESFDPRVFGDLSTRGGLCTVHGERVVLLDIRAPLADRVVVLARVAGRFDTESLYIPPRVRETIAACASERSHVAVESKKALRLVENPTNGTNGE